MASAELTDMTEHKVLLGTEPIYGVADPTGTPADRKIRVGNFFPRVRPYFIDADTYLATHNANAAAGFALTANRIFMGIVYVPYERAFTKCQIYVTATQGTSGIRLGVYNVNQQTFQPTTLIEACTAIDSSAGTGTTGSKQQTITQTLPAGFYGLAVCTDGTPSVHAGTSPAVDIGMVLTGSTQRANYGIIRTYSYAALPADESAQAYTAVNSLSFSGHPVVGLR